MWRVILHTFMYVYKLAPHPKGQSASLQQQTLPERRARKPRIVCREAFIATPEPEFGGFLGWLPRS